MVTATRRIQFCSGHRLVGHESMCRHFHGHNYVALLTAVADDLDEVGRVIDFSVLKAKIGGWIHEHWDHSFLLWDKDREGQSALETVSGQPFFLLPSNPTAENMAAFLLDVVGPKELEGTGARLVKVELWETENCKATVQR